MPLRVAVSDLEGWKFTYLHYGRGLQHSPLKRGTYFIGILKKKTLHLYGGKGAYFYYSNATHALEVSDLDVDPRGDEVVFTEGAICVRMFWWNPFRAPRVEFSEIEKINEEVKIVISLSKRLLKTSLAGRERGRSGGRKKGGGQPDGGGGSPRLWRRLECE